MKKVVYSIGWGAGWSTWSDKPKEVAEYLPVIEFLQNGGLADDLDDEHPIIVKMKKDLDLPHFYTGGRDGLNIASVDGDYRISEHDGSETIETRADFW